MEYYEGFLEEYLTRILIDFGASVWWVSTVIVEHRVKSDGFPEAVAVANCLKYSKPNRGMEGILKVRMR